MSGTRAIAGIATIGLVAVVTACGVPSGEASYSQIPADEIPFGLNETSTSTTSTTTPTTTIADPPQTTEAATTTPIRLEPVEIYFLSRGRLQPVVQDLPTGFSADQLADVLEAGPRDGDALDTLIEDGLITGAVEAGGVLTVDLDSETFDRIPSTQQTEAIGQIVLTMSSWLRRIGQVTFTLDGEPIAVKKGNSLLSEVGEPLSFDDYVVLLVRTPSDAASSTTTTSPSTTTEPPAGSVPPTTG